MDPAGRDFTLTVAKISRDHAPCTRPKLPEYDAEDELVTFALAPSMGAPPTLAVWYSNFEDYSDTAPLFERRANVVPAADGTFTLNVTIGSFITVTTILEGPSKGSPVPPPSQPAFPLPYADDFTGYPESSEPNYLSDQIGAFEIHPESDAGSNPRPVLRQMVPQLPIGWSDHGTKGPVTVVGMREWNDIGVTVDVKLPPAVNGTPVAGCVAARSDQSWDKCVLLLFLSF